MNNSTVRFLRNVELANELVDRGVVIDDTLVNVLPLATLSNKISNAPPFVKDDMLTNTLLLCICEGSQSSKYCKP